MSGEEGLSYFLAGLRAVEGRARDKGIKVLIEPEPGLLIENSFEFLGIYGKLDPEVFGLNFDIGHFFCVGEDPASLVSRLKDCAPHFHLEDIDSSRRHHHLMLGDGAVDIPGVLEAIENSGFAGYVTVELYTYSEDAQWAAGRAFEYLSDWRKGRL
jgi:sugar phosphate isomerase/epimerase